jgi:arsenite methyltransferase
MSCVWREAGRNGSPKADRFSEEVLMTVEVRPAAVDVDALRCQISDKYTEVAKTPEKGFHFHTGKSLALMLGYPGGVVDSLPAGTVESFAGVGNPFSMSDLRPGETVLDIGCGAGFDSLIAARQVGEKGRVMSIDMTPAMLDKAAVGAREAGIANIEFREGLAEALPIQDASIDVVISNGVINLCPDKMVVMQEVNRVLKPGGRIQIADIVVHKEVPQDAKDDIDLWSG